jgi:DNA (cytosine-5)-methyltransferase 1
VANRPPQLRLYMDEIVIDGFAGGGGTSTGIEMALGRSPDVAINHDPIALAMHEANHPETRSHRQQHPAGTLRGRSAGRRVGLLWLSPDCTHPLEGARRQAVPGSAARAPHPRAGVGSGPLRQGARRRARRASSCWRTSRSGATGARSRGTAGLVPARRELSALEARAGEGGGAGARPSVRDRGRRAGRVRLRRAHEAQAPVRHRAGDGQPMVWPEPTHGPGRPLPYRTAAECLDFTLPVPSIFLTQRQANAWAKKQGLPKSASPRRPLAPATKRRIARGVQRFVLDCPEPFIVNNLTNNVPRPVSEPLATILTGGHKALVQPTLAPLLMNNSETRGDRVYPADEPIRTLTAEGCRTYQLVTPVLAPFITEHANASSQRNMPADEPLRTICAQVKGGHFAVVAPFLAPYYTERVEEKHARTRGVDEPLPTITTQGGGKVALIVRRSSASRTTSGTGTARSEGRAPGDRTAANTNRVERLCPDRADAHQHAQRRAEGAGAARHDIASPTTRSRRRQPGRARRGVPRQAQRRARGDRPAAGDADRHADDERTARRSSRRTW